MADGDGTLTQDELKAIDKHGKLLSVMDKDANGSVSIDEWLG